MSRRHLVTAALAAAATVVPLTIAAVPGTAAGSYTPTGASFRIGHEAGEPTLGFDRNGTMYVAASSGCVTSCLGSTETVDTFTPDGRAIMSSADRGVTWQNVSPGVKGVASTHVFSLDPYVFVDETPAGNRIFDVDLTLACSEISFSDDGGANWITNPVACGEPVNDHQTLFSGKPVKSPTIGYPKVVYYCFNHPSFTKCTKSLDGGLTFIPTAQINAASCSGLNGHGVTNSLGWIFLPMGNCSSPTLAISKDEGDTWQVVNVRPTSGVTGDPSVAVDSADNLYYVWEEYPSRLPKLTVSRNSGATWSTPVNVAPAGVQGTNLATIDVGSPGNVAIAYYGTTGNPNSASSRWHGYLTAATGLLTTAPSYYSVTVNNTANPLKVNYCGPARCGRVLDFIDVEIAPDGTPWGAYVDACLAACEASGVESIHDNDGLVGTMVGGPPLR
ncbi:MAG TPA: sialidase family protein [Frankiaceae bacterium]|nr:sialidase family protein [Frankiaceae bacterium]